METTTGKKKLFRDSKLGIFAGFVAAQAALGVVEWLGTVDFSSLPTWAATSAALGVGAAVNAITAWAAKRRTGGVSAME
jgi:hypothetical protein